MGSFTLRDMNLPKKLDQLESWLRNLKSSQLTGKDVVAIHESTRPSAYDFALAPGSGSAGYAYKYIVLVPDKQENPSGVIRFQIGSGNINNVATTSQFGLSGQDLTFYEPPQTSNRIVTGMNFYNDGSTTLYFKAYAEATDTGTVYVLDSYSAGGTLT